MKETRSRWLTLRKPTDVTQRWQASLALSHLPTEEPFPPLHAGWKTCASFCHVNALAAGQGELWAATWGGVVRWRFEEQGQGVTFTRFASEHGLPGSRFQCIALDSGGRPWAGGAGAGLSTFDGERWHTFTVDDGLPSNDVLCFAGGADGRLWAGVRGGLGGVALDGARLRWQHRSLDTLNLPAKEIRALAVDRDTTLWLGTDWGLYQVRPDGVSRRYTVQQGLPCLQVTQLATDGAGRLWVGTMAGLGFLNEDRIESHQDLDAPILGLSVEPGGKLLWVVTPQGISVYTPKGLQAMTPHPALTEGAQGRAIAVDETGRRWLGYTEGVTQQFPSRVLLSANDVDLMTQGENTLCNCITTIQVDDGGRVWAGTPQGLWFLERDVWRKCQPGIELEAPLVNIQAIALAPKGLWAGGWREDDGSPGEGGNGLRQFDGTTDSPLADEAPELPYVDTLVCDTQGRVWIAAAGVVRCFDGENWKQLPLLPAQARDEVIQALAVDERDVLWCGTTGGLWCYDGKWHRESTDAPVQALACKGKEVWAGTTAGLKRLSGKRKRHWKDVDGLPDADVTALAIGLRGVLWVGTTRGLARIKGRGRQVFTARESGLASDVVQALAWDGDTLWIGTANGLSRFSANN
jgi:ligand-binding sensor domain-containing protein